MPMFRVRFRGVWRGISLSFGFVFMLCPEPAAPRQEPDYLPAIVREGLVRLRHPVRVFALLDGAATQVRRVEQLIRKLLLHRLAVAAIARVADQPADAQGESPIRIHFDR